MKNFPLLAFVLFFLSLSSANAKIEAILGEVPLEQNENILPIPPLSSIDLNEVIISRKQYVVSYNRKNRSPNWAAWKIDLASLGRVKRTNVFLTDDILENYLASFSEHAVLPTDFYESCFDRGHQVPSADRNDSVENNQATFVMSNMLPQTAFLNRVIWEHLESYTRDLVVNKAKKVYVVAGPIYDENFGMIGPDKDIPVPSKNFKIIYILSNPLFQFWRDIYFNHLKFFPAQNLSAVSYYIYPPFARFHAVLKRITAITAVPTASYLKAQSITYYPIPLCYIKIRPTMKNIGRYLRWCKNSAIVIYRFSFLPMNHRIFSIKQATPSKRLKAYFVTTLNFFYFMIDIILF